MLTNIPLNLRRVCEVKQSGGGKKKLMRQFQLKSALSFGVPPNHHVDSQAINWAVLVNTEIFIYQVDIEVNVSFFSLPPSPFLSLPLPSLSLVFYSLPLVSQDFQLKKKEGIPFQVPLQDLILKCLLLSTVHFIQGIS